MKIKTACKKLMNSEIVILPSDTLYGLAARAYDSYAVFQVFAKKEREINKSLPIHYASLAQMKNDVKITPLLEELAHDFWPGNLTIVAKKIETSKLKFINETIAIRIPAHKTLLRIINQVGPITMPSANKTTHKPHKKFKDARKQLRINGIKDDSSLSHMASTIIDISNDKIKILRSENPDFLPKLKKYEKLMK